MVAPHSSSDLAGVLEEAWGWSRLASAIFAIAAILGVIVAFVDTQKVVGIILRAAIGALALAAVASICKSCQVQRIAANMEKELIEEQLQATIVESRADQVADESYSRTSSAESCPAAPLQLAPITADASDTEAESIISPVSTTGLLMHSPTHFHSMFGEPPHEQTAAGKERVVSRHNHLTVARHGQGQGQGDGGRQNRRQGQQQQVPPLSPWRAPRLDFLPSADSVSGDGTSPAESDSNHLGSQPFDHVGTAPANDHGQHIHSPGRSSPLAPRGRQQQQQQQSRRQRGRRRRESISSSGGGRWQQSPGRRSPHRAPAGVKRGRSSHQRAARVSPTDMVWMGALGLGPEPQSAAASGSAGSRLGGRSSRHPDGRVPGNSNPAQAGNDRSYQWEAALDRTRPSVGGRGAACQHATASGEAWAEMGRGRGGGEDVASVGLSIGQGQPAPAEEATAVQAQAQMLAHAHVQAQAHVQAHAPVTTPCSICLEPMVTITPGSNTDTDRRVTLPCAHGFHAGCIEGWERSCIEASREVRCPECRHPFGGRGVGGGGAGGGGGGDDEDGYSGDDSDSESD